MPTRTKPKRPVDPKIEPVAITLLHQANLCESAGLKPRSQVAKAFLAVLEPTLSYHTNMIRRVPLRSLPAHTIAALKPIAAKAAELAALLDPAQLPIEVLAELRTEVSAGALHADLLRVAYEARRSIAWLSSKTTQGHKDRALKDARNHAFAELDALYQRHAGESVDASDRAEFHAICGKYLKG